MTEQSAKDQEGTEAGYGTVKYSLGCNNSKKSMKFNLEEAIALLARFPAALDALLRGLPEAWISPNEGENTMSVFEVVGHLIHLERTDWLPRANVILQFGEKRPFEPVDGWAHLKESQGKSMDDLLDEFAGLRAASIRQLRALDLRQDDFEQRGQHPALGTVTLAELLATWAAHDMTHLHQISRVMAHQYREAVGPWSAYLGVLQCRKSSA